MMMYCKTHFLASLIDAEDAKMQVNIHFPINFAVNNELGINLVDICLGDTLQISCKSLDTCKDFKNFKQPQNGLNVKF